MQNDPFFDKPLLGLVSGYIIGILVSLGYISPASASAASQNADQLIGGIILIVTILGWFAHHIVVAKNKGQTSNSTTLTATTTSSVPPDPATPVT